MVMPSGRRSSEPVPVPKASGSAPNSAAMVVIRMGRKRSMQASKMASSVLLPSFRSATSAKSIIMMAFFFTMPIEQHDADDGDDVEIVLEQQQRQHGADAGRRQRGDDGQRMHQALVQNAQHDVDRQQGRE